MHSQRMAQAHLFCCQRWPSSFHMFSRLAQVSSALLSHPLYGQIFVNKNGSSKFTWNWVRLGENKQIWLKMAQVIPSEKFARELSTVVAPGRCPRRFAPVREQLQLHSFQAKRCHSRAPKSDLWHKNGYSEVSYSIFAFVAMPFEMAEPFR